MTDVSSPVAHDDATSPPTFELLPLSPETRAALARMGYQHPTPVQRSVFEPATRGKDLVVQARTGTGKTTAFGLPIVEHSVRRNVKAAQVLCLCPTRELALQVAAEIRALGEGRQIEPLAIYGGAPMGQQIEALQAGAQVIIGTPGRVLDHIRRGTLQTAQIRMLVLDEADEMLSMGFERELTAILDMLPPERQTLLFSATLPSDIERIARERLRQPEFLTLSGDHVGALSITHFVYFVTEDKLTTLLKVVEVENPESAVVFCNTKADTEVVASALQRAGYDADWLNGDLPQNERESVMGRTKRGELRFLVATDVAARGIDISHLTHVINYDFPDTAEAYVHRTGRTGRAGRTGTAISLIRAQNIGNLYFLRLTYQIRPIERQIPTAGERKTRRESDLVHMIAEAYRTRPVHPDDLQLARRLLTHDRADAIIACLLRDHLGDRQASEENASAVRRSTPPPLSNSLPSKAARSSVVIPAKASTPVEERARPRPPSKPRPPNANSTSGALVSRPIPVEPPPNARAPIHVVTAANAPVAPPVEPSVVSPSAAAHWGAQPPVLSSNVLMPGTEPRRPRARFRPVRTVASGAQEPVRYYVGQESTESDPCAASHPPAPSALLTWHPPEEEGDDRPILSSTSLPSIQGHGATAAPAIDTNAANAPTTEPDEEVQGVDSNRDYAEIFVDVGRRDGVRPSDFQKALRDRGGISRRETGRIRVRDRHAFVCVKRELLARALEALSGALIAGRTARAEVARDREAAEESGG